MASMVVTTISVWSLSHKRGLPIINQFLGWTLLGMSRQPFRSDLCLTTMISVVSSALPFFLKLSKATPESRILMLFLGFSVCFVILSISSEGLFYGCYAFTLITWIEAETALRAHKYESVLGESDNKAQVGLSATMETYRPQADDLRIAVFFLFFVQVGFFGTGK